MSVMTIRAPDSVTALELVQRRLGDDALILSVLTVDGQVEITATSDPVAAPVPQRRPAATAPDRAPAPAGAGGSATVTWLPRFMDPAAPRPFAELLEQAKTPAASPPPDAAVLRDAVLSARRIVLFGPAGAGKSLTALQLAAEYLTRAPGTDIGFAFCGAGSHGDGALLAQKSHLLGMTTRFCTPDNLADPAPGTVQIVVISGRAGPGPEAAQRLQDLPGAQGVLVLPAGLRPERMRRLADPWIALASGAVLSAGPDAPPLPEECADLLRLGLTHLWTSASDRMVAGLSVPAPEAVPAPDPTTGAQMFVRRHSDSEKEVLG